ncbi:MAG: pantoate--beta-alanine ligase [bacterium]|nr:pantoate--beta-alanine ligase [bacterium]
MKILKDKAEVRAETAALRAEERTLAIVPTMGYLHEGHLELIREGARRADVVAVSIFVNPLQFNDPEDFEKYPVNTERDLELCAESGADLVFMPAVDEMYPGFSKPAGEKPLLKMAMPDLTHNLCGEHRPGHFDGVLMIVGRLFNLFRPDFAIFGRKDYQQYLVVRRLALDLDFGVEVVGVETVREDDGLAMSSRNARLGERGREQAALIHRSFRIGAKACSDGTSDPAELKEIMSDVIESGSLNKVEYLEILDADTLRDLERVGPGDRYLIAAGVFCEGVRLIDNLEVLPGAAQ